MLQTHWISADQRRACVCLASPELQGGNSGEALLEQHIRSAYVVPFFRSHRYQCVSIFVPLVQRIDVLVVDCHQLTMHRREAVLSDLAAVSDPD